MQTLLTKVQDGVGWIRFHRPEVRNAVNMKTMEELEQVLTQWEQDRDIKVIVFEGNEKAFVSGGDVEEFSQKIKQSEIYPVMERMGSILEYIHQFPKITIAAVEGVAVGGGCEIVTSCDFCLASEHALFGFIQVHLGITTGWGGASRLLHKIGSSRGLELLLTGERISSERALEIGLVDKRFSYEKFQREVAAFAYRLATVPDLIIQTYKQIARKVEQGQLSSSLYTLEAESCSKLWETEAHREAVDSFLSRTRSKEN
jgi:enoyl-CoA hydratase/carnithine racemase